MASGFGTVEVDTWLEVIPQVCANGEIIYFYSISIDHRADSNSKRQYSSKYH